MEDQFIYWKCNHCGSFHKSDKMKRHSMDWCKCGQSAVDAEEFYSRWLGEVTVITKEQYERASKD